MPRPKAKGNGKRKGKDKGRSQSGGRKGGRRQDEKEKSGLPCYFWNDTGGKCPKTDCRHEHRNMTGEEKKKRKEAEVRREAAIEASGRAQTPPAGGKVCDGWAKKGKCPTPQNCKFTHPPDKKGGS